MSVITSEYYEVDIGTKSAPDIKNILVKQNKETNKNGAKLIVAQDIIERGVYEVFADGKSFVFYYPSKEEYLQTVNGEV